MAEIFRRIKNQNYTVMCNHHLQNDRLSLKAMGLMSKIISLPDDWNYSVRGMTAVCKDGYESVRTAFLELEREGYIVRQLKQVEQFKKLENKKLSENIDYMKIEHISSETKEKLNKM